MKTLLLAALAAFLVSIPCCSEAAEIIDLPAPLRDFEVVTLSTQSEVPTPGPSARIVCARSLGGPQEFIVPFPERGKTLAIRCPLAREMAPCAEHEGFKLRPRDPRPVPDMRLNERCTPTADWSGWMPVTSDPHDLSWPVTWELVYTTKNASTQKAAAY